MKARLGQNFLADEAILQFEAEACQPLKKSVLEIGAGDGRLTDRLLREGAGHLLAVELDERLARKLRERLAGQPRAKVHQGDFLGFDESARFNVIVGNIPYYITTPILMKLARMDFDRAVLCVQKEVAERMVAQPGSGNYGRLSVFCQLSFGVEVLAVVPKEAFSPMPKVDSCIIQLVKGKERLREKEERIIGAIFSHRKKSVRNAVVDARRELFGRDDKAFASGLSHSIKYFERRVFTLAPSEALEVARGIERLCQKQT